jgi:membrane associated rhomboid family serine protease
MIPLGDSEAVRRLSPANMALLVTNLVVFGWELWSAGSLPLLTLALVPERISHLQWIHPMAAATALLTLVSSLFLHADVFHIGGNMLYLLVFGPAVEQQLGHLGFVKFYLSAGIAAGLATVSMTPQSSVPVIGASGAIAGVLGGYFVLYPRGRIRTVLPKPVRLRQVEVPAIVYLLIWFAAQLYFGIASGSGNPRSGEVAWWSHVGGFLFGVAAVPLMAGRKGQRRQTKTQVNRRR